MGRRKKLYRDSHNMADAFYEWLGERLPIYLKKADKEVDLDHHKFEYNGKVYTEREMVQIMNDDCKYLRNHYFNGNYDVEVFGKKKEIREIWCLVAPHIWW